ncbi:MAG: hypothetical protein M1837_005628 [Sclerophora amabilis]|nr:MAG: hypothetical protein M1837_005628 [Sclerophora amabilis]
MPPRKSDASKAGATGDEGAGTPSKDKDKEGVNVEVVPSHVMIYRVALIGVPAILPLPASRRICSFVFLDRRNMEEADLGLPRTMVQRLAKGVLPANTQIQKDAALALSKSATVFVSYLSSQYVCTYPRLAFYAA